MKSCLQCGKEFGSTGRFNRICKNCKKENRNPDTSFFKTCFSPFEVETIMISEENKYRLSKEYAF